MTEADTQATTAPATTPDGVRAKARLLWEEANIRIDDGGCEVAWFPARNLLAGASAGADPARG